MIDVHYWPAPDGWKVTIVLEECGLEYRCVPVDIGSGDQFKAQFLQVSSNNRTPAILDHKPADDRGPIAIFESGAILATPVQTLAGYFFPVAGWAIQGH